MTLHPKTRKALQADGIGAKRAVSRRDARIVRAVKRGGSLREVAEAVGLSHTAVANIVNRHRQNEEK